MTDDIKDLLGKAIGDEPPLGVDRDEVFRVGRQRVRRRRALAAGGVVAAVVAAAVGATTLTNFVEVAPESLPPAASDSWHAPPGPDLPLPPASTPASPPLTETRASGLTQKLYESRVVSANTALAFPARGGKPGFRVADGVYLFEADVIGGDGEGVVQVTVGPAPSGREVSCEDADRDSPCAVTQRHGRNVAEATWQNQEGERRNLAVVVLPDGTKVAAMASNFSRRHADAGKKPAIADEPVLNQEELAQLIVKSGFSVH